MNEEQLAQSLAELQSWANANNGKIDHLQQVLQHLEERTIPASVAGVTHELQGNHSLLASLAGTVHSLASQMHSMSDRLTLLERAIDHGPIETI